MPTTAASGTMAANSTSSESRTESGSRRRAESRREERFDAMPNIPRFARRGAAVGGPSNYRGDHANRRHGRRENTQEKADGEPIIDKDAPGAPTAASCHERYRLAGGHGTFGGRYVEAPVRSQHAPHAYAARRRTIGRRFWSWCLLVGGYS